MHARVMGWMLAACAAASGFQAGSQKAASVEGRVVEQATGSALKNAVVTLRELPRSPYRREGEQLLQQTNSEGRFLFAEVPEGDWLLSADKRGFVPGRYGARRYDSQGSRISVKPGQKVKDIVVRLVPQTVIAGRVLDNEGQPIEGARVAILKLGYANRAARWSEVASAVTLDNGEYRIPRVAAGRYLVKSTVARIELGPSLSGVETAHAGTYHPNATDPAQAATVEVRDDGAEVSGIDIHVSPVRVFHVRGRIVQQTSYRADATIVLLERSNPSKVLARTPAWPPEYLFDFPRIPPGSYIAYGWLMVTPPDIRATQTVEVGAEDVDNLVLNAAAGEIQGGVRRKPGGREVDLSGLSVEIRPVWLDPDTTATLMPRKLDAQLKFRCPLSRLEFASFAVVVSPIPEGCYVSSIQYGGRDVPDSGIEYSHGAALEITIASDGAAVGGTTVDGDGNPFADAVVALLPADGKGAAQSSTSGPRGAFRLTSVPPGEYKLLAFDDIGRDDLENPELIRRFDSQAATVRLEASGTASASIRVIIQ